MEKSTLWFAKVPGLFLKHKDEERRKKYLARAKMIKNKVGELTHENQSQQIIGLFIFYGEKKNRFKENDFFK